MKRLLFLLLLFVNLQIIIKCDYIGLESSSTASAQGWDVEVNPYHCKDDGGWFWSSIPCEGVVIEAPYVSPYTNTVVNGWELFLSYEFNVEIPEMSNEMDNEQCDFEGICFTPSEMQNIGNDFIYIGTCEPIPINIGELPPYKNKQYTLDDLAPKTITWTGQVTVVCRTFGGRVKTTGKNEILINKILPSEFPKQETKVTCLPTCATLCEMAIDKEMTEGDYIEQLTINEIRYLNNSGLPLYSSGVSAKLVDSYMSILGFKKIKMIENDSRLRSGYPIIGTVATAGGPVAGGHAVVIVGYNLSSRKFICMDPGTGEYEEYSLSEFWQNMFYQYNKK